jgi:PAS domain S-box-containing protein
MNTKQDDCRLIFDALPGIYLILRPDPPDFTIVDFNQARAEATMSDASFIGKKLFDVFSDNPDNPEATGIKNLTDSLMTVIQSKKPHTMALQRYDLYNPTSRIFEERYWLPKNSPVIDENGNLKYIIHSVEDVTETVILERNEKLARDELSRLHHEQTQILESIADAFLSVDHNWVVQYWNKQAERIFQISREQILGKYLWDYIKEQKDNKLYECFMEAMQKMKPSHFEKFYSPQNIWLQVNAYPSKNGLTAFLLDITEQRTAQEALENNEKRFRALVENSTDGITVLAVDGTVLDVSYSGKKILGYEPHDLVGKIREDLIHPDDLAKVHNSFQKVTKIPSASETIEYRFKMPDGNFKWLEGTFHNLTHEKAINAIVLNYRDITARKEQQEQLLASEEKYHYLFNNNPAAIIIWTLSDLKIHEVNKTAVQLFGYTKDEFLRMTTLDIRPVEERERFLNQVVDLRKLEGPKNAGTWVLQNSRGDLMHMNISFHRISYVAKDAVLALGTDITERVQLEKKLELERKRRQREITEAVLTAQENERADLGKELHDNINQILTTTRLYIEYALAKKGDQDELLTQSHGHISKAIQEIRQLSRTLMPPSLGETTLKLSLEELFANIKALKTINFSFVCSIKDEHRLNNDLKFSIFRIVQEQLNNIIKHSKANEVRVELTKENDLIYLSVKDNGVGFDPKKGTRGLGFRNIISRANLYNGQVSIESQPGSGTELRVTFRYSDKASTP